MSVKILAIDTATENCSVALLVGEQLYTHSEVVPRDHTKKILPMVDDLLKQAGLALTDLDALAYGRGPGSFTGVRIGIGIAQGLSFGAELPMIGISTLEAMAQGSYRATGAEHVACAIDARMSEVYWARYQRQINGSWSPVDQECVMPPSELVATIAQDEHSWISAGTGWAAYQDELAGLSLNVTAGQIELPEAQDIVVLAKTEYEKGNTVLPEDSAPVYLRDKVAWKKLPGRE